MTRIVLIGYGPVGARFVEETLPAVRSGVVTLTVIGAEDDTAYNRVLLAEYAVGRADRERLEVIDDATVLEAGVLLRLGEQAISINRTRQTISLKSGELVPYDRLVLATGARANVPTLDGLGKPKDGLDAAAAGLPRGVEVLRDIRDGDAIRAAVEAGQRIVVLGAGVLGMELALAAQEQGADVVVVHHGDGPMARNLDTDGGRMLARAARAAGVEVVGHSRAESVLARTADDGRLTFDALICADGKLINGDLLVLSCGVGARSELAARAGLAVGRGVLVDEELRSWTDPDIFAIGDCAHVAAPDESIEARHVAGAPAGLIGPGWRQADWLAAALSAEATGDRRAELLSEERRGTVMLKSEHVHVVSGGMVDADAWDESLEVSQWIDRARGGYAKIVARDGVITGFVSVGMPRLGAELTLLFERGSIIPTDPAVLLRLDAVGSTAESSAVPTPDDTVCWCNGVQAKTISACASRGITTVEGVGAETRAGTGCGGCKGRIAQLIAAAPAPVEV